MELQSTYLFYVGFHVLGDTHDRGTLTRIRPPISVQQQYTGPIYNAFRLILLLHSLKELTKVFPSNFWVKNFPLYSASVNCRKNAGFSGDTNSGKGPKISSFLLGMKKMATEIRGLPDVLANTL